ncbi:MAG: hypothetical protein EBU92_00080 [Betaproteobacteria bacterium]|nr:hypothetical protein [Betaproteobacteria bacterium]
MKFQITPEFVLVLFCGVSILGLIYILNVLTKGIPKRLYILVPIPLYLLILFLLAAVYFLLK